MGTKEEPRHRAYGGVCRDCGKDVIYHSGVKRHPDYVRCSSCEKAWIVGKLTGEETIESSVMGQG